MRSTWAEQAWAVLRKDVLLEARTRANVNAVVFFAGMALLVFSFALGPNRAHLQTAAAGILWLALIFSGVLAIGRIYQIEAENGAFEGLLLTAQNRSAIYLGKMLGAIIIMVLVEIVLVPLMAVLYDLDFHGGVPLLALACVLGTVGFAAVGALYGALTMSLRVREVLLPLLLLPVIVPILLGAVKATSVALNGGHGDLAVWLELLVAFDVVFVTAGLLLFEYAVGE
jgi:heme exporter protein B